MLHIVKQSLMSILDQRLESYTATKERLILLYYLLESNENQVLLNLDLQLDSLV